MGKGQVSARMVLTALASVIIAIFIMGIAVGNYFQAGGASYSTGAKVAGFRISQALDILDTGFSHSFTLNLSQSYSEIEFSEGKVVFRKEGEKDVEKKLGYSVETTVSGLSELCIFRNQEVGVEKGDCLPETAGEEICSKEEGYYSSGGVFTDKDLTRYYYRECEDKEESFFEVNAVNCPERAEPGTKVSCFIDLTYMCGEGEKLVAKADMRGNTVTETPECTGEVESEELLVEMIMGAEDTAVTISIQPEGFGSEEQVKRGVRVL